MGTIDKINNVSATSINKVDGSAISGFSKVNNETVSLEAITAMYESQSDF